MRRYEQGFLHGKAFIVETDKTGVHRRVVELHLRRAGAQQRVEPRAVPADPGRAGHRLVQRAVGQVRTLRPCRAVQGPLGAAPAVGHLPADAVRELRRRPRRGHRRVRNSASPRSKPTACGAPSASSTAARASSSPTRSASARPSSLVNSSTKRPSSAGRRSSSSAPATLRDSTWAGFLRDTNLRAEVVSYRGTRLQHRLRRQEDIAPGRREGYGRRAPRSSWRE